MSYLTLYSLKNNNKKFELMLTRRAKAYSSTSSQTVSLSPAFSSQFILGFCAAAENRKINSMSVPICNRFHATPDNCGKITTF